MIGITPRNGPDDFTARTQFLMDVSGVADMRSGTRSFSPTTLHLEYEYSSEHGQWALSTWKVTGPLRVKDGSLSSKTDVHAYGWGWYDPESIPTWVQITAGRYRPVGVVSFGHHSISIEYETDDQA